MTQGSALRQAQLTFRRIGILRYVWRPPGLYDPQDRSPTLRVPPLRGLASTGTFRMIGILRHVESCATYKDPDHP